MSDDGAGEQAPQGPESTRSARRANWLEQHRSLALLLGCVALCGVLAIDLVVIAKRGAVRGEPVAVAVPSLARSLAPPGPTPAGERPGASAPIGSAGPALSGFEDYSDDGEPHEDKPAPPRHFDTVQRAAVESCTTASVDGLSRQIIAQARCIKPNAFVPLPSRPNLSIGSQVFPYLELEARNNLVKALDARPTLKMTVNSALRTVAQQYLVWRWSATKRCGVPLATPPGESNHEIGIALDIAEAALWRPTLEAHQFRWLGASDRVHFDFKRTAPASTTSATDVLAFQTLWNRNHPADKIPTSGQYDGRTEERLKQSPPDGFKLGPSCGKR